MSEKIPLNQKPVKTLKAFEKHASKEAISPEIIPRNWGKSTMLTIVLFSKSAHNKIPNNE